MGQIVIAARSFIPPLPAADFLIGVYAQRVDVEGGAGTPGQSPSNDNDTL